jgi:hypothetical protein
MDTSIFTVKTKIPDDNDLRKALGSTTNLWQALHEHVHLKYPEALDEWNYSGEKYGWSFRIKDKKRAIVYLLPRDKFFKVALVFGQKATDAILNSPVSEEIKRELESARVYAEGRGIRLDIKDNVLIDDVKRLIDIKMTIK